MWRPELSLPENALFIRAHELIIGPRVLGAKVPIEPATARKFLNRLVFTIEKTTTPNPNKSKISIYNISQDSRNFLEQENMIVFLKAGFNNEPKNIFLGEILRREASRKGPDIIYTLELGDTEKIISQAFLSISLGPGATNVQVLNLAAAKLGLSISILKGITVKTFVHGYSENKLAADIITEQTKNIGLEWNIQDGELRILPRDQTDGEEAVVISKETGLIGFVTKTQAGIKFKSLLNADIRPGRATQVISSQFQGQTGPSANLLASASLIKSGDITKCRRVIFTGDTREGKWEADVETIVTRTGAI